MSNVLNKILREHDYAFCIRAAIAMSVIYCGSAVIPVIVDPLLKHHVIYPNRQYASYVIWSVLSLSLIVMLSTYSVLALTKPERRFWIVCIPTLLFAPPILWLLRPEVPHKFFISYTALGIMLTVIATWIRYSPVRVNYLSARDILPQAKIERVKEELGLWRNGLLYGLAGFLTMIFAWFHRLDECSNMATPDPAERMLIDGGGNAMIVLVCFWFLFGVLAEIVRKCRQTVELLERIPKE